MAAKKLVYGSQIFKNARHNCKYCVPASENARSDFDSCISPVCIWKNRMRHIILLQCPSDGCVYIRKQDPKDIELVGKYITKFAVDGYLFMPHGHKNKFLDKIHFSNSTGQYEYLCALLLHFGWKKSVEQDDADKGVYFTNLKEVKEVVDVETLAHQLQKSANQKRKRKPKSEKQSDMKLAKSTKVKVKVAK